MAKTLAEKLYIREGYRIALVNPPEGYNALLRELPRDVRISPTLDGIFDWLQCFVVRQSQFEADVERVKKAMKEGALLWIAYPKAGQLGTDLNRDRLAEVARSHGLQAVAQVSIDD